VPEATKQAMTRRKIGLGRNAAATRSRPPLAPPASLVIAVHSTHSVLRFDNLLRTSRPEFEERLLSPNALNNLNCPCSGHGKVCAASIGRGSASGRLGGHGMLERRIGDRLGRQRPGDGAGARLGHGRQQEPGQTQVGPWLPASYGPASVCPGRRHRPNPLAVWTTRLASVVVHVDHPRLGIPTSPAR